MTLLMSAYMQKLVTRDEIAGLFTGWNRSEKKVGFTSGVFDIVHPGHVDYLEKARAKCDCLVVGINSDSSVQENKGSNRPIVGEKERAQVIAALASVDFVFIFSEKNNAANIEALKPDFYIKAGDYKREELSSAKLVEAYGGKVLLVPVLAGYSSSAIIEKISSQCAKSEASSIVIAPPTPAPAAFIDRDGTINEYVDFLAEPEKLEIIPGAFEGIKLLRQHGYRIVIVTNQPGIGLGYFTKEDFYRVNRKMMLLAREAGVVFDKILYCPHSDAENCSCRKPSTGMVERGIRELNIIRERSVVIGDMTIDIQLARNAGMFGVLVKTGRAGDDKKYAVTPDLVAENLLSAARVLATRP